MKKTELYTIPVKGMHCRACELLIQDELSKIKGVQSVVADSRTAKVRMQVCGQKPSEEQLQSAIRKVGYELGTSAHPWFNQDKTTWVRVLGMITLIVLSISMVTKLGVFNFISGSLSQPTSLSAIALLGLTAGFSTCAALVGGLLLAFSSAHAKLQEQSSSLFERFEPTIFFQIGRIVGFMLLGAVLGWLGSGLQPTPFFTAVFTGLVAVIMIWFGAQLTGLFPKLSSYQFSLPSGLARMLHLLPSQQTVYSPLHAAIIGALTFFVPCGFTQVVQLYAVSSASPFQAAVVMGVFALTTVPGLTLVSVLGNFTHTAKTAMLTQFVGVLIVIMGAYSLLSAKNLMFAASPFDMSQAAQAGGSNAADVQTIEMTQTAYGYSPRTFTVKKGKLVRWVIDSKDQYGCASNILLAKYGINTALKPGKNIFEFTPEQTGTLAFSCSMGMYAGTIQVVD